MIKDFEIVALENGAGFWACGSGCATLLDNHGKLVYPIQANEFFRDELTMYNSLRTFVDQNLERVKEEIFLAKMK